MIRRHLLLGFGAATLAACGATTPFGGSGAASQVARSYDVAAFQFVASPNLSVSEGDGFYPFADIVWRGDPPGDRTAQIAAMFETAIARNDGVLVGDTPVAVRVQLIRFHGVTEKTRFSVGGNYNIVFDMTVSDARTGAVIEPTRRVVGNLDAPGGSTAARLERDGQTEKVRVTGYLTSLLRAQLS